MSKIKLETLINTLIEIKEHYKETNKKEPYLWDLDSFGSDISEIKISPKPKDTGRGFSVKSDSLKTYTLSEGFLTGIEDGY